MWEERSTECLHAPWALPLSLPPAPHWEPARWELLSSQEWSCGAPCDTGNQGGSCLEGEKQQHCLPLCFHTSEEFILFNYELKMKILVSVPQETTASVSPFTSCHVRDQPSEFCTKHSQFGEIWKEQLTK